MKASVFTEYGPPEVLQLKEVAKPTPQGNEILVRVRATSVNYGDLAARNFRSISPAKFHMPFLFWLLAKINFGILKPKLSILGNEFAGEVESTGADVQSFKPGDQVFGFLEQGMGAYAEYLCLPEGGGVALKPLNMSYEEAAVIPMGAIYALNLLRKLEVQAKDRVLVIGASGSIGSAAVQLARHYGAVVTGVCSTPRLEFVKSLGADKVIDYTKEDFTQNGATYDLIIDVLGKSSFSRLKRSLEKDGRYLLVSFKSKQLLQMIWTSIAGGKQVICALASHSAGDLRVIRELVEAGAIKAAIDRRFPLEQAAEAHRYVESGGRKGHIAITLGAAQ